LQIFYYFLGRTIFENPQRLLLRGFFGRLAARPKDEKQPLNFFVREETERLFFWLLSQL